MLMEWKNTVIMSILCRAIYRFNRTEISEITPHIHSQLIYDRSQDYTTGKEQFSSINGVEKTGKPCAKDQKWPTILHHTQK